MPTYIALFSNVWYVIHCDTWDYFSFKVQSHFHVFNMYLNMYLKCIYFNAYY